MTADHASSMVYSGFAAPKNSSVLEMDKYVSNVDGKPYQLLTYSSGIGYSNYSEKNSLRDPKNSVHKAAIPATWANHAASDVPLYAIGPMANLLFSGTFDQTYVPHALAYALCLFQYSERCDEAYVRKLKPINEKKSGGIDELKKVLNKESGKFHHSIEDVERRIKEDLNRQHSISQNISVSTDSYKSSDLVANFNETENNASAIKISKLGVFLVFMIAINRIQ